MLQEFPQKLGPGEEQKARRLISGPHCPVGFRPTCPHTSPDTQHCLPPCFRKFPFPFFLIIGKICCLVMVTQFMAVKSYVGLLEFLGTSFHWGGPPQMKQPGCNFRKGADTKDEIRLKTQIFLCPAFSHNTAKLAGPERFHGTRPFFLPQEQGPAHGAHPAPNRCICMYVCVYTHIFLKEIQVLLSKHTLSLN